ncbi:MAG: L-rhamnose/proton symporter RhaT [Armatimonadota bacterium]
MTNVMILGAVVVALAGLIQGSGGWPMKLLKKFQFEHWWFLAMFGGLIVIPWAITLIGCPNAFDAYRSVPLHTIILSNACALSWGIANLLCGLCLVRIGFALTGALMTGLGVSLGVTIPMIVKGSGLFKDAPDIGSTAGKTVLVGVAIMLLAVIFAAFAGFGRDRALQKMEKKSGSFLTGMIMAICGGILSCGISFAFVYSQGPIVTAMQAQGASLIPANFAVWAVGLLGGALINVTYPMYLMTKNKSWGVLTTSWKECALSCIIAVNFSVGIAAMGWGMLLLGALGASVGFGIQQAMQMTGNQGVGFISGEWRGVNGKPRYQIYASIALLLVASIIMAYANRLARP